MAIPYSRYIVGGVPWYSALIVLGILATVWLTDAEVKRKSLPRDTAVDVALVTVPCGIVGARLYYVAMTWELFAANPISILYVWEGGVAIYGGVIGGCIGALIYAKRKKLSFLEIADCVVPGLLLAQAIGRWGNYFNMEAYGPEITNKAFQFFPAGVLIEQDGRWVWHMATFFYESAWNLCGVIALWLLRKRQRQNGNLFCWYLLIYGSGRFIIEQLRQDSLYVGSLRASQYLSLILCAASAGVLLWRAVKGDKRRFALALVAALLLVARWFALEQPWAYAALALAAVACAALAAGWQNRFALWLLLPLLLDGGGLACQLAGLPTVSLALRLHTLLCSVTLPVYVGLMAEALQKRE